MNILGAAPNRENTDVQNSNRDVMIDVAKGIGMLFVIFAHINHTPVLRDSIYAFHMPFFFLISGILFNREKYSSFAAFFERKVRTLLCPYAFFCLAALALRFVWAITPRGFNAQALTPLLQDIMNMIISPDSISVANGPLWFLTCLFVVEILYYLISATGKPYIMIACFALSFAGWLLESPMIRPEDLIVPWSSDTALFVIGFFAIGNLLAGRIKKGMQVISEHKSAVILPVCIIALCAIVLLPIVHYNGGINLGRKVLNNGILVYCSGIIGSIGVLAASVLFKNCRFFQFCGKNSLAIMAIHCEVLIILNVALDKLGMPYDDTDLLQTIIPFVTVTAMTLVCALIYNKLKTIRFKQGALTASKTEQ